MTFESRSFRKSFFLSICPILNNASSSRHARLLNVQGNVQVILNNPLLSFCFFAAGLLLLVSLIVGILRRDFKIFFSRRGLIHLALAIAIATLLLMFRYSLLSLPFQAPPTWFPESIQLFLSERISALLPDTPTLLSAKDSVFNTWPLAGISRLPLYIFALAYGPTAGLVAGLIFSPIHALGLPGYVELLLVLELCVLGWLAIVPSSFQNRWAGSFNVLLAYALIFFSGGFAYLLWQGLPLNLDSFWRYLHPSLGGVLLSSILLFLFGPKFFKKSFPTSGIIYETIEAGLEDIVVDKPTLTDEELTIVSTSETVKSSLADFSPSVSTTVNLVSQDELSKTLKTDTDISNEQIEDNTKGQPSKKRLGKIRGKKRKLAQVDKIEEVGPQATTAHAVTSHLETGHPVVDITQNTTKDTASDSSEDADSNTNADTSADTNIYLTNVDDLMRVTGIGDSVYSEFLNDLPDHLSEETMWLINFLLTEAKASTINTVYKAFKESFGPSKKRFKKGIKEAHAEGWLTLMRDIERDEVFVGLGRKLLTPSQS